MKQLLTKMGVVIFVIFLAFLTCEKTYAHSKKITGNTRHILSVNQTAVLASKIHEIDSLRKIIIENISSRFKGYSYTNEKDSSESFYYEWESIQTDEDKRSWMRLYIENQFNPDECPPMELPFNGFEIAKNEFALYLQTGRFSGSKVCFIFGNLDSSARLDKGATVLVQKYEYKEYQPFKGRYVPIKYYSTEAYSTLMYYLDIFETRLRENNRT